MTTSLSPILVSRLEKAAADNDFGQDQAQVVSTVSRHLGEP